MRSLSHIVPKIFLRDNIWRRIVGTGFREASHVTRSLTLVWDEPSFLNLIVRRLVVNDAIYDFYGVVRDEVLSNLELQRQFFARVFPPQIDAGDSRPTSLGWMLSRTADSSRRTAPRELIHLLLESRDQQLKQFQLGNAEPPGEVLIDKSSIRSALPAVSKVRYEQTLCAENPSLKPFLDKLEREKTQQTPATLAALWKCSEEKSGDVAEQIAEAGFFERRGRKESPSYWVPFLYRDALAMVQGTAEG